MRPGRVLVTLLAAVAALLPARASAAPVLRHVTYAATPATTDGGRYAVWLTRSGRAAVLDTRTRRTRTTPVLCPRLEDPELIGAPLASSGVAVVTCGQLGVATGLWRVNLTTVRASALRLPLDLGQVTAVGRAWLVGNGRLTDGREVNFSLTRSGRGFTTSPIDAPPIDPDRRRRTPLRYVDGVDRLLLDGAPWMALPGSSLRVRDPRRRASTLVTADCRERCGVPFGRVGRLAYVRYHLTTEATVVVERRGRPRLELTPPPSMYLQRRNDDAATQVALTADDLITSTLWIAHHGWDIRRAPV